MISGLYERFLGSTSYRMTRDIVTLRLGVLLRVGVFSPSSTESDALDEESPVLGRDFVLLAISGDVRIPSRSGVDGTDLSVLRMPNHPSRDSDRGALYSAASWKKKLPSRN
jgi:hypothetical protein